MGGHLRPVFIVDDKARITAQAVCPKHIVNPLLFLGIRTCFQNFPRTCQAKHLWCKFSRGHPFRLETGELDSGVTRLSRGQVRKWLQPGRGDAFAPPYHSETRLAKAPATARTARRPAHYLICRPSCSRSMTNPRHLRYSSPWLELQPAKWMPTPVCRR